MLIADRMAEAGISNMGAYMRKMALNGYVLHVDLSDIRELVALQRRCANNLNQVAVHANTYGIYPSEIAALQKDYADLWEPLSELLKKLLLFKMNLRAVLLLSLLKFTHYFVIWKLSANSN